MASRVLTALVSLLLLGAATGQPTQPEMVPFNRQYGFGAATTGGLGKPECFVTNLSDDPSVSGTLRDVLTGSAGSTCCSASNGCIVAFDSDSDASNGYDLEGEILTTRNMWITQENITVDGARAGPNGVYITAGCGPTISGSNQIWRYLAIRSSHRDNACQADALSILPAEAPIDPTFAYPSETATTKTVERILLDHMTLAWGRDENLGINDGGGAIRNVTIQNSILAHAVQCILHVGATNVSYVGNLFTGCLYRHPLIGADEEGQVLSIEYIANVVHNYTEPLTIQSIAANTQINLDFVDNSFIAGDPATPADATCCSWEEERGGLIIRANNLSNVSVYSYGNYADAPIYGAAPYTRNLDPRGCDLIGTNLSYMAGCLRAGAGGQDAKTTFRLTPHFRRPYHLTAKDTSDLAMRGALGAGALRPSRSTWDTNILATFANSPSTAVLPIATAPHPTLSAGSLTFAATVGGADPGSQTSTITNLSYSDTIYWTAAAVSEDNWLSVTWVGDPAAGSTLGDGGSDSDDLTISVDITPGGVPLAGGRSYIGYVTVTPQDSAGNTMGYKETITVRLDLNEGGTDNTPIILTLSPSSQSCTRPCSDLTLSGSTDLGRNDLPVEWKYDIVGVDEPGGTGTDCAEDTTACSEACWSSLGETESLIAVALDDINVLGVTKIRACVEDADGDDDHEQTQVTVLEQTIAGATSASLSTCTAGSCIVDVTVTIDEANTTCPWDTTGYTVGSTSCGVGCTKSVEWTGPTALTDSHTFVGACTCPSGTTGVKLANATLTGCGTAPGWIVSGAQWTVTPPDPDDIPQISSASFNKASCQQGAGDCDLVTVSGSCVAGTCDDTPVAWAFDTDDDCGPGVSCDDPCFESNPFASGASFSGVTVPAGTFPTTGDVNRRLCLYDTQGDFDSTLLPMTVTGAAPTFDAQGTASPASGAAPLTVSLSIALTGTDPDIGSDIDVTGTSCGTGGVASAGFAAGVTGSASNPIVFTNACTYASATSANITATVASTLNSDTISVPVSATSPTTTFTVTTRPQTVGGANLTTCTEPCVMGSIKVDYGGNFGDPAGIQTPGNTYCRKRTTVPSVGAWEDWSYYTPLGQTVKCYDAQLEETQCGTATILPGDGTPDVLALAAPLTATTYEVECHSTYGGVNAKGSAFVVVSPDEGGGGDFGDLTVSPPSLTWNVHEGYPAGQTATVTLDTSNTIAVNYTEQQTANPAIVTCNNATGTTLATRTCTLAAGLSVSQSPYATSFRVCNDDVATDCETVNVTVNVYPNDPGTGDGVEARCTALGPKCFCSEPYNGPNASYFDEVARVTLAAAPPPATQTADYRFDPVDSPDAGECAATEFAGTGGLVDVGMFIHGPGDGIDFLPVSTVVNGSSIASRLPPGHSLSYVFATSELGGKQQHEVRNGWDEARDWTICMRSYGSFDETMAMPIVTGGVDQYKTFQGMGDRNPITGPIIQVGIKPPNSPANRGEMSALTNHTVFQLGYESICDGGNDDGPGGCLCSGVPCDYHVPATSLGTVAECTGRFCRMESCLDFNSQGQIRVRWRKVVLPNASSAGGATYQFQLPSASHGVPYPGGWSPLVAAQPTFRLPTSEGVLGFQHFSQSVRDEDPATGGVPSANDVPYMGSKRGPIYYSHVLIGTERPMNGNFWLGPACEVEGGCATGQSSYTTTFSSPLNEYPVSQGGKWFQNNVSPSLYPSGVYPFNKIKVVNGRALHNIAPLGEANYDGYAHLSGFEGNPDQWAEATYWAAPGASWPATAEGSVAVRMTSRSTHTQSEPLMETYGLAFKNSGAGPTFSGGILIGLADGHSNQLSGNTFYDQFTGPGEVMTSPPAPVECTNGLSPGDKVRLTVQGQMPATLNAYIKRGAGAWVHCATEEDYGYQSLQGYPTTGPSWHTPFTTGNPGISLFSKNLSNPDESGWDDFTAGVCPALPASCAP